jgi:hypothetical protein
LARFLELGTARVEAYEALADAVTGVLEADRAAEAEVEEAVKDINKRAVGVTPRAQQSRWDPGPRVDGVMIRPPAGERQVAWIVRQAIPSLDDALKRLAEARVEVPTI